jgi:RNA polymerase sigma-70 factor, ECF subfamily
MPNSWSDDGFESLFRALYPRVVRASALALEDREAAEDVAQEAFVRLLTRSPLPPDDAERWVFRVARNLTIDRLREGRRLMPLDATPASRPEGAAWPATATPDPVGAARLEALRAAVGALPERQREVVGLRIYGELSYEAIAAAVGRSLGAVRQELHRARVTLREKVVGLVLEDEDA